jgi:hypothetical protein
VKAIETAYKGYRFRSRLEARWAVFFDALGIVWEYEKEGFELPSGRYLPDFWIPIRPSSDTPPGAGWWVEIKPVAPTEEEAKLLMELTAATGHNAFCFAGNVGLGEFKCYKAQRIQNVPQAEYIASLPATILVLALGPAVEV